MKQVRLLVCLLFAAVVSGCSTTPIDRQLADKPKSGEGFVSINFPAKPSYRPVHITRDQGFLASGLSVYLWVDGKYATQLQPAETTLLYLSPGRHELVAVSSSGGAKGKHYPPLELESINSIHGTRSQLTIDTSAEERFDVRIQFQLFRPARLSYSSEKSD